MVHIKEKNPKNTKQTKQIFIWTKHNWSPEEAKSLAKLNQKL